MSRDDFLSRYRWLPAAPDDRLAGRGGGSSVDCVRVGCGGVFYLEVKKMAKKPKSRKRNHCKLWICYTCDKARAVLTREADSVWLDAHGSLVFNAQQCRTLATWLNKRADEMEAK